jgi:hypothetical protein
MIDIVNEIFGKAESLQKMAESLPDPDRRGDFHLNREGGGGGDAELSNQGNGRTRIWLISFLSHLSFLLSAFFLSSFPSLLSGSLLSFIGLHLKGTGTRDTIEFKYFD